MNLEDNGVICIVGYITQSSTKRAMVQKVFEDKSQAFSSPKITIEPDNSESLLANNKSNPRKKSISTEFLSDTENDIPVIYYLETMRNASCKYKQSTNKLSAVKKIVKKIETNAKLLERMLKPTRLYHLKNNDLATRIKCEEIKQISKRKLVFGASFFELCTVLQMLQETDLFAQKIYAKAIIDGALPERIEDL